MSKKKVIETPKKMGIHVLSNAAWAPSGYGVQARLFMPRLQKLGYQMSMTAFYGLQGHTLNMDGYVVFPQGYHPYGLDVASNNCRMSGADILLTNMDAWVIEPQMIDMTNWVPWFPVDSEPLAPAIESRVKQSFERIVYSKFAIEQCEKAGLSTEYIPMAVDTKAFFPADRKAALELLNAHIPVQIPQDNFVVSMVAMNKGNPSRKAFIQNIRAFKELHLKHPDTVLYLHTGKSDNGEMGGIPLTGYITELGLTDCVFFPELAIMINGYPDDFMNAIYNTSDVLLACTMGEGFGIPIVEAQSAGCPVIVGDWTSMPELCFSGWKVDKKDTQEYRTFLGNYMYSPNWQAIYEKLELAYDAKDNKAMRDLARKGALAYDADLVTEKYWKPVMEKIEAKLRDRPKFIEAKK